MYIPNGFKPSLIGQQILRNTTGIQPISTSPTTKDGVPITTDVTRVYPTEAEREGTITPFLARNRVNDAPRRNYVIRSGGVEVFFKSEEEMLFALGFAKGE